jgi:putative copper export protein
VTRRVLSAVADVLSALAMVAWVGGQAALGAFAARIAFQELARPEAARTMNRVFHEFDRVILVAVVILAIAAIVGALSRASNTRSQIRLGLELGLCVLGVFEIFYVHHGIEAMFLAGRTLEPAFRAMHSLSERCAHLEALLVVAVLTVRAWPRPINDAG